MRTALLPGVHRRADGQEHASSGPRRPDAVANAPTELWYLVYRDEQGTPHTVKGSVNAIRKSLRDGLLGDAENVRASRTKAGPFEPLKSFTEFRDILASAADPDRRRDVCPASGNWPARARLRVRLAHARTLRRLSGIRTSRSRVPRPPTHHRLTSSSHPRITPG